MRLVLPAVASQTKKISLPFLFLRRGAWGEPDTYGKEIFWFCFRRFRLPNEHWCYSIGGCVALLIFSSLRRTRRVPQRRLVVTRPIAKYSQSPAHSPLVLLAPAASAFTRIRLVASREFRGNSLKRIVLEHKQICMCLPHPPMRAQIPTVLRQYYKTAGIAPLYISLTTLLIWYTLNRSVTLNGYGFSRPFRLMRVESPSGYGLAERIHMEVKIKKILGATRRLILDHA